MSSPSSEPHKPIAAELAGCSAKNTSQKDAVGVCVLTISDTRTIETDIGGKVICNALTSAGHQIIDRQIVIDNRVKIRDAVHRWCRDSVPAILVTGGTGLAKRDITPEAIEPLFQRTIPGFGELFRMLSYDQVGAAAMLSRASAGVIGKTVVFTMPGSPKGVQLAMEKLIIPELAHVVSHANK